MIFTLKKEIERDRKRRKNCYIDIYDIQNKTTENKMITHSNITKNTKEKKQKQQKKIKKSVATIKRWSNQTK